MTKEYYLIKGTSTKAKKEKVIQEVQRKYPEQRKGTEYYQFPEGFLVLNPNFKKLAVFVNPLYGRVELSGEEESALVRKITSLGFECRRGE